MNLNTYEYKLEEMIEEADTADEAVLQSELSIVRRAKGYLLSPEAEAQFVKASRREIQYLIDRLAE